MYKIKLFINKTMKVYFTQYHYYLCHNYSPYVTVPWPCSTLSHPIVSQPLWKIRKTVIPNLQKRKLRLREVRWLLEKLQKKKYFQHATLPFSIHLISIHLINTLYRIKKSYMRRTAIITSDLPKSLLTLFKVCQIALGVW